MGRWRRLGEVRVFVQVQAAGCSGFFGSLQEERQKIVPRNRQKIGVILDEHTQEPFQAQARLHEAAGESVRPVRQVSPLSFDDSEARFHLTIPLTIPRHDGPLQALQCTSCFLLTIPPRLHILCRFGCRGSDVFLAPLQV